MFITRRFLTVTQGNLNNNHLYLHDVLDLFPADVIGGNNRRHLAPRLVRVLWGGKPIDTDIVTDKQIFRRRSWVGKFFAENRIAAGDRVLLEKLEPYLYRVSRLSPELAETLDAPVPDSQKPTAPTESPGCAACGQGLAGQGRPILSRGLGGADWLKVPVVLCLTCHAGLGRSGGATVEERVSFWFRCVPAQASSPASNSSSKSR